MNPPPTGSGPATEPKIRPGRQSWLIWALVFVVIIYPLSVGPTMKLCVMGYCSPGLVSAVYSPLRKVLNHSPSLRGFFDWYIDDLWRAYPRSVPIVPAPSQSFNKR
jgi:hypothetical protein